MLKVFLTTLLTVMVSLAGSLPAGSVVCLQEGGEANLELSSSGNCACKTALSEAHQHDVSEEDFCTLSQDLHSTCTDLELFELISNTHRIDFVLLGLVFALPAQNFYAEYESRPVCGMIRLTKPHLPPPHLKVLAVTQLLI